MIPGIDLLVTATGAFFVGHLLGWAAGRSSGKVAAIEAAHGIDLSGRDDDRGGEQA